MQMPDAQFNLRGIVEQIAKQDPGMIEELLPRAVYDGMRQPLQTAAINALADKNPAAALAAAQRMGNIGSDPVPQVVSYIAKQDPIKASALWAAMPSSRSKALSAIEIAKAWSSQDASKATKWVRENLQGL
jgi:hypothetical protein